MASDLNTAVFSDEPAEGIFLRPQAQPWVRFWARRLDQLIWMYPIGFLIGVVLGVAVPGVADSPLFTTQVGSFVYVLLILPFAFLADALVLAVFGNTPGKWLCGIRAENADGSRLTLGGAVKRNMLVYVFGFGLAIPLLIIVAFVVSYNQAKDGGKTRWDKRLNTRVVENGANLARTTIAAILVIALTIADQLVARL